MSTDDADEKDTTAAPEPVAGTAESATTAAEATAPEAKSADDDAATVTSAARESDSAEAAKPDSGAAVAEATGTEATGTETAAATIGAADADAAVRDPASDDTATVKAIADGDDPAPSRGRRRLLAAVLAAVVLIAAVVTVGLLYRQAQHRQDRLDDRAAATRAACDFGHAFATFSADRIDDYLKLVSDSSTGDWKKQIDDTSAQVKKAVLDKKVNSTAGDVQCGIEAGSDHDAHVLLLINQSFSSAATPDAPPNTITAAATVEMQKVSGKWLVAKFDTPALAPPGK
ncbi:hypothetical protein [Nocardia sp. alder85J]|uniref:hypothetical protein n=1 Tax=Nocardia sp. alder85J TaxID=2862949 RepID=UPI001CD36F73|nr:hypothetical protein [Nocardia sp. alder85J]MCX4096480.1 hypothetical protein [Nocardia sp. alder85J]